VRNVAGTDPDHVVHRLKEGEHHEESQPNLSRDIRPEHGERQCCADCEGECHRRHAQHETNGWRTAGTLVPVLAPESPLRWWFGFPMALLLTCVIEVPAYLGAFWTLGWCRSRPSPFRPLTTRSALALALAVNLISHPLLWMISLRHDRTGQLITAEMCVAVIEGMLIFAVVALRPGTDTRLSRLGWSLLTALGVNTLSLLIGMISLPAILNG
jgi:hypothetical protein